MKVEFTACKHLDFEAKYAGCKRQMLGGGKLFWMRPNYGAGIPRMVQFCQKKGRMNSPKSCIDLRHAMCSDYIEFKHVVEIEEKELES